MTTDKEPWENSAQDVPIEFETLLDPTQRFSLSEFDISPNNRSEYAAGTGLALLHSIGIIHGDLHPDHLIGYDPRIGNPRIVDFDGSKFQNLSPKAMAGDFVIAHATFEWQKFVALLAGYVKASYTYLEPEYVDYVSEFIRHVGGCATDIPQPREPFSWVTKLVETLQIKIEIRDHRIKIVDNAPHIPAELWNTHLDRITMLLCGLIVAGVNFSALMARPDGPANDGIGKHFHDIFCKLCSGILINLHDTYPSQSEAAVAHYLKALQQEGGYPKVTAPSDSEIPVDCQPDQVATAMLFRTLSEFPSEVVTQTSDSIIDVCDYLSQFFEDNVKNGTPTRQSMDFAQHSFVLLSHTLHDCRQNESRLLTSQTRHRKLSWARKLANSYCDFESFVAEFAYGNSKCCALLEGFSQSLAVATPGGPNALWSIYWDALKLSRKLLLQCQKQIVENIESPELESPLNQIVSFAVGKHFGILKVQYSALLRAGDMDSIMTSWTGGNKLLMKEVEWASDVAEYMHRDSILSPEGVALFNSGLKFLQ